MEGRGTPREKKKSERGRTKCTKRKTDGIWVPHGESTRTPHKKKSSISHSSASIIQLFHSLIHPIFCVSVGESQGQTHTWDEHATEKLRIRQGKDDNENFVMIYLPSPLSFFLPRKKKLFFLAECLSSFPYNENRHCQAPKKHYKATIKWFIWFVKCIPSCLIGTDYISVVIQLKIAAKSHSYFSIFKL